MSEDAVGVAVAQFAPGPDEIENVATIRSLATRAAERGARLVVFPEYSSFFVDPVGEAFVSAAQSREGSFVNAVAQLTHELNVYVVAGMAEMTSDPQKFSNTAIAVAPDGGIVASYRKQHLYDAFGAKESDWVCPGEIEMPETFDVDGLTVGLQTCYDLRFPELSRRIADAGASLIVVPSEWVLGPLKEHHWRTLATARAIENTVYIAAADQTPPVGVGASLIVDPMGVALAELGEEADVALAWVRPSRVEQVRAINPTLALRRYRVEPL